VRRRALLFALAAASAWRPAWAAERVTLDGAVTQGGFIIGRAEPGARVVVDGKAVRVTEDGRFVFGYGREAGADSTLTVTFRDGTRETRRLTVAPRQFDVQRIDGLPDRQVTPPPEVLARIKRENDLIAAARSRDSATPHFLEGFIWPATGRISGVYGSQRILNGQPRQPHYGIDVAVPEGTPVVAPAAGTVTLAEPDLYFTGGTVIIDHGHGVFTIYSHLKSVEVAVGDAMARGQRLGTVGATGRATGPHLDWRLNWFQVRLDPMLAAPPMPKP